MFELSVYLYNFAFELADHLKEKVEMLKGVLSCKANNIITLVQLVWYVELGTSALYILCTVYNLS